MESMDFYQILLCRKGSIFAFTNVVFYPAIGINPVAAAARRLVSHSGSNIAYWLNGGYGFQNNHTNRKIYYCNQRYL